MKQPGKGGGAYGKISNAAVHWRNFGGTRCAAGAAVFAVLGLVRPHRRRSSRRWPFAA